MGDINKRVVNRYYCAILYEEDPNYKLYVDAIKKNFTEITWIKHNRDINEDGEIKKSHIHILFKVGDNARHITRVADIIGIPQNYLQGCNKEAMLLYFLHKNNPEKTQYKFEEVQGELKNLLLKLLQKQIPEENKYNSILTAIQDGTINSYTTLMIYGIRYSLINEIKKSQFILCKIIDEKYKKKDVDN